MTGSSVLRCGFIPERKNNGDPPRKTDGLSDAVLMYSREGQKWDQAFQEPFIRPGLNPNNWGSAHGNQPPLLGLVDTDQETHLY